MKNLKFVFIVCISIFLNSCGYSPLLKDINLEQVKIQSIKYDGPSKLIFFAKSKLPINPDAKLKEANKIEIKIKEFIESRTKNSAGITTEEDIEIIINLIVKNNKDKIIIAEEFSNKKVVSIANDPSKDNLTKQNEKENILSELMQQLSFVLQARLAINKK